MYTPRMMPIHKAVMEIADCMVSSSVGSEVWFVVWFENDSGDVMFLNIFKTLYSKLFS